MRSRSLFVLLAVFALIPSAALMQEKGGEDEFGQREGPRPARSGGVFDCGPRDGDERRAARLGALGERRRRSPDGLVLLRRSGEAGGQQLVLAADHLGQLRLADPAGRRDVAHRRAAGTKLGYPPGGHGDNLASKIRCTGFHGQNVCVARRFMTKCTDQ